MGLVRAARHAGTSDAPTAMLRTIVDAARNDTASVASTP